jgi:hypothetical protein
MNLRRLLPMFLAVGLLAAACGDEVSNASPTTTAPGPATPVAGDPLPDCDDPACDDVGVITDVEAARQDARAVLGMQEGDLPEAVRIARRGTELFGLTADYVIGRLTAELDDDGSGFRVVSVTVELPAGPETFGLEAG